MPLTVTPDQITSLVKDTLPSSISYVLDGVLGAVDKNDVLSQLTSSSLLYLLLNPSSVYDLLLQGAKSLQPAAERVSQSLQQVLSEVERVATTRPPSLQNLSPLLQKAEDLRNSLLRSRSPADIQKATEKFGKALLSTPGVEFENLDIESVIEAWSGLREDLQDLFRTLSGVVSGVADYKTLLQESTQPDELRRKKTIVLEDVIQSLLSGDLESTKNHFLRMMSISSIMKEISSSVERFNSSKPVPVEVVAIDDGSFVSVESSQGPFDLRYDDTIEINGVSSTLGLSSVPYLRLNADPTSPSSDIDIYTHLSFEGGWGSRPLEVSIASPGLWPHGRLDVLTDFSVGLVGRTGSLRYEGDKSVLSALDLADVEENEQRYMVVWADGSTLLVTPQIELEPPLPHSTGIPLTNWRFVVDPLITRWHFPPTFTKSSFVSLLNGPLLSEDDVLQPWHPYIRLSGSSSGNLRPGERVYVGAKQAVVIYHNQTTNKLYIHQMSADFLVGEVLTGRESLETYTIASIDGVLGAEIPTTEGQPNPKRYWTAKELPVGVLIEARDSLGGGTQANLSGVSLTLTLNPGEFGFDQLGMFPGSEVTLGGTTYVLDSIQSNVSATVAGLGGSYTGPWSAPVPEVVQSMQTTNLAASVILRRDAGTLSLSTTLKNRPTPLIPIPHISTRVEVPAYKVTESLKTIFSDPSVNTNNEGKISLSSPNSIVFWSGSSHTSLGLPVSQTSTRTTSRIEMYVGGEKKTIAQLGVVLGDVISVDGSDYTMIREDGYVVVEPNLPLSTRGAGEIRSARESKWMSISSPLDNLLQSYETINSAMVEVENALYSLSQSATDIRGRILSQIKSSLGPVFSWIAALTSITSTIPNILSQTSQFLKSFEQEGMGAVAKSLLSGSFVSALQDSMYHQATSPGEVLTLLQSVAEEIGVRIDPDILEDQEDEGYILDEDIENYDDAYEFEDIPEGVDE